ncbi:type VI secretion system baseplate subunit TssE [Vitiosangium sp. GDMCC 1.1324]|uniref:type VI secretion system baseplate subunit TssE n=1 Tax=Vitiosangium sp. (strain GDMCC 1.1324) TaxID=2138576 RepID=UPI000D3726C2|nr:type VI secretion system baseplate subunit TssE [Vitiosangium sp. GDMCC 1.1324]PTL82647.1 type VI secretion system baseplate subunit TssE [Vitiosangium sp. GDMCC 1.1324]
MTQSKQLRGFPAPLFDRLMDLETVPAVLDEQELRASVRREVAHALSTRCMLSLEQADALEPHERSVLDYGLPDLRTLGSTADAARQLERIISRAVEAYEPRLRQLRVSVRLPPEEEGLPVAVITARLVHEPMTEPITFPLQLDRSGRLLEVGEER